MQDGSQVDPGTSNSEKFQKENEIIIQKVLERGIAQGTITEGDIPPLTNTFSYLLSGATTATVAERVKVLAEELSAYIEAKSKLQFAAPPEATSEEAVLGEQPEDLIEEHYSPEEASRLASQAGIQLDRKQSAPAPEVAPVTVQEDTPAVHAAPVEPVAEPAPAPVALEPLVGMSPETAPMLDTTSGADIIKPIGAQPATAFPDNTHGPDFAGGPATPAAAPTLEAQPLAHDGVVDTPEEQPLQESEATQPDSTPQNPPEPEMVSAAEFFADTKEEVENESPDTTPQSEEPESIVPVQEPGLLGIEEDPTTPAMESEPAPSRAGVANAPERELPANESLMGIVQEEASQVETAPIAQPAPQEPSAIHNVSRKEVAAEGVNGEIPGIFNDVVAPENPHTDPSKGMVFPSSQLQKKEVETLPGVAEEAPVATMPEVETPQPAPQQTAPRSMMADVEAAKAQAAVEQQQEQKQVDNGDFFLKYIHEQVAIVNEVISRNPELLEPLRVTVIEQMENGANQIAQVPGKSISEKIHELDALFEEYKLEYGIGGNMGKEIQAKDIVADIMARARREVSSGNIESDERFFSTLQNALDFKASHLTSAQLKSSTLPNLFEEEYVKHKQFYLAHA